MPNHVPAVGAISAACGLVRLKFALFLLRTSRRFTERAARIIEQFEGRNPS
jgi:hypothetical protein